MSQNAIAKLTRQIEAEPDNAWLYEKRGWAYGQVREWVKAQADYGRAIVLEPEEIWFWLSRAHLNLHLGHLSLASRDLEQATQLDPENPMVYVRWASYYKRIHEPQLALAKYDRAIALKPLDPDYHRVRAEVLADMGELGRALDGFAEALRLDPQLASTYYKRAYALLYNNPSVQPEAVLSDLDLAIRLDPEKQWYRRDRAFIYFVAGRWQEAIDDFAAQDIPYMFSMCKYAGAEIAVFVYLAQLWQGKEVEGREFVTNFLDWYAVELAADPDDSAVRGDWGWPLPLAHYLVGSTDEIAIFERLYRQLSESELIEREAIEDEIREAHLVLGERLLALNQPVQARSHFQQARGLPMRNPMRWVLDRRLADDSYQPPESTEGTG